jgi:hypothetical protein
MILHHEAMPDHREASLLQPEATLLHREARPLYQEATLLQREAGIWEPEATFRAHVEGFLPPGLSSGEGNLHPSEEVRLVREGEPDACLGYSRIIRRDGLSLK